MSRKNTNQQEQKQTPKKTQQQKPKQTKGTRTATKQQGTQLNNRKKDYDKIIKEINTVYEKVRDYSYSDPYPESMYLNEFDFNIMKTFRKATGLDRYAAREICESLFKNLVSDTYDSDFDEDEDEDEGDTIYYFYDVLKYNKKLLNKLLENANDTILKNDLKNYIKKLTKNIKEENHSFDSERYERYLHYIQSSGERYVHYINQSSGELNTI